MSAGWIKIHRKLTSWEWYNDVNTTRVFLHLLLVANHKDNKWRGIEIKRGQRLTSISALAIETNLSIKNIRTSIKRLKSTNEVASHSTAQHTVFTMVNYDLYQEGASEVANKGQAKGKQGATNKNDKNVNKEKEDICKLIFDKWNELFENKLSIPLKLNDKRRSAINGCIKEMKSTRFDFTLLQTWSDYFEHAEKSNFLMGENKDGWKMSFDFVITKSKLLKIVEGEYDN
tara:strand:+ start:6705 stop:7394 length:690 start_codon:yes stop_codon:yes gene_type:complete